MYIDMLVDEGEEHAQSIIPEYWLIWHANEGCQFVGFLRRQVGGQLKWPVGFKYCDLCKLVSFI